MDINSIILVVSHFLMIPMLLLMVIGLVDYYVDELKYAMIKRRNSK